jgi:hypothetical protein
LKPTYDILTDGWCGVMDKTYGKALASKCHGNIPGDKSVGRSVKNGEGKEEITGLHITGCNN